MPGRVLPGAMCVQRFDDSLNSAIHITYRISLRSSSMPEPRDPLLKVLTYLFYTQRCHYNTEFRTSGGRPEPPERQGCGAVLQRQAGPEGCNDARTGMPARMLAGAMCVQRFDDSRNSAIRITYRISLRSSSMPEPRDPLLKVLTYFAYSRCQRRETELSRLPAGAAPRGGPRSTRRSNV